MFVPATPNSKLLNLLKVAEKEVSAVTGDHVHLAEVSGQKLRHLVVKSNPWAGGKCNNHTTCWICSNPYNKVFNCDLRSVTYSSYCILCRDKAEAEAAAADGEKLDKGAEAVTERRTEAEHDTSAVDPSTADPSAANMADPSAASTADPSAANTADPSAASTVDPSAASTVTGTAMASTVKQQAKKPKTKAKFKQYFGESHRSMMGGGPGGEGGRAFEHS